MKRFCSIFLLILTMISLSGCKENAQNNRPDKTSPPKATSKANDPGDDSEVSIETVRKQYDPDVIFQDEFVPTKFIMTKDDNIIIAVVFDKVSDCTTIQFDNIASHHETVIGGITIITISDKNNTEYNINLNNNDAIKLLDIIDIG